MIAESALVFSMACTGVTVVTEAACVKGYQAAAIQSGVTEYVEKVGEYIEKRIPLNDTSKVFLATSLKYSIDKSLSTEITFKFLESEKLLIEHSEKDNKSLLGLKWSF